MRRSNWKIQGGFRHKLKLQTFQNNVGGNLKEGTRGGGGRRRCESEGVVLVVLQQGLSRGGGGTKDPVPGLRS